MTLNNKILKLPSDQKSWLMLMKVIFKRTFDYDKDNKEGLIDVIEKRAIERGYNQIELLFDTKELKEYFMK